jgi:hypothetical protein
LQQLDDEILETDMLQFRKKDATIIKQNSKLKGTPNMRNYTLTVPKPTRESITASKYLGKGDPSIGVLNQLQTINDAGGTRVTEWEKRYDGQPYYHPRDK